MDSSSLYISSIVIWIILFNFLTRYGIQLSGLAISITRFTVLRAGVSFWCLDFIERMICFSQHLDIFLGILLFSVILINVEKCFLGMWKILHCVKPHKIPDFCLAGLSLSFRQWCMSETCIALETWLLNCNIKQTAEFRISSCDKRHFHEWSHWKYITSFHTLMVAPWVYIVNILGWL